ncbi:MAG: hypothetical protein DRJ97_04185 [Thermoprotei archaeon]|nr:MAG: hypothetical protein DRJ97_04185 [Thermoprotei archaeon]
MKARKISLTALFTALVCAFTVSFQVYIPATKGYFNVGEVMVYTAALVAGPWIGAFAGGVGSMLADLLTGFAIYAPATLVIKGAEGFVVGWLSRVKIFRSQRAWRVLSVVAALAVASLLSLVAPYYVGVAEVSVGPSSLFLAYTELSTPNLTVKLEIPLYFWLLLASLSALAIIYAGFKTNPEVGWTAVSVSIGGFIMVAGYYLYEQLFMGVAALAEVPFNVAQFLIGLLVAIPLARAIKRAVPSLLS